MVFSGRTILRIDDLIVGIVPAFAVRGEEEALGIEHRQLHPSKDTDGVI
ncbi:MAG: hypothetical protein ACYCT9_06190 [Leptospirillum sp.]